MKTNRVYAREACFLMILLAVALMGMAVADSEAMIHGIEGPVFNLTARSDYIYTPDGGNLAIWGYGNEGQRAQYPGPTLIVKQNDEVTINLQNTLPVPVSIIFPGQEKVLETGGVQGLLAREAPSGGNVTYSFTASHPGTYLYQSGTRPELQVEMGLVGAIIVRPLGYDQIAPTAYGHTDSSYDREYLFLLTEMDPRIHELVACEGPAALESTSYLSDYFSNYWFINGRCAPDTMLDPFVPWLPTQPYSCMPMMHPGEKLLMRVVVAGRDMHPFHHHGNHARTLARDGRLLESVPGAGADLSTMDFTIKSIPGQTVDAIFEWTGKGLGWDIYGHGPDDPLEPGEYAPDHGKPFPVGLPGRQELTFGGFWSGSPFLGTLEMLPPGEGGMNPHGGYTYMWHSHTEKEMTNNDIFPGGMMTMLMILPHGVPIMH